MNSALTNELQENNEIFDRLTGIETIKESMEKLDEIFDNLFDESLLLWDSVTKKLVEIKENMQKPNSLMMGMFPGLNYPYIMKDDQPEEVDKAEDDKNDKDDKVDKAEDDNDDEVKKDYKVKKNDKNKNNK